MVTVCVTSKRVQNELNILEQFLLLSITVLKVICHRPNSQVSM